jgi:6-pyruvoyltetrahydropterin/6-carboxytetrahydropterin synthase
MTDHGEISLEMTFDAGHRIVGHKGKCSRLHGHTYKVHVMASGPIIEPGFVVDFGDIKDLVNEWDHRMLLWEQDRTRFGYDESPSMDDFGMPVWDRADKGESDIGVIRLPFNPTAENMAKNLAERIFYEFRLEAVMVELWETPKSMARYVL